MPLISTITPSMLSSWVEDKVSALRAPAREVWGRLRPHREPSARLPLPPSPPITHLGLGHLHEIRTRGFVRFLRECVETHGPLVLLHMGPPVLGRRVLVIADPEVALQNLQQDRHREFLSPIGPPMVFGEQAVFCTSGDDPVHAERQRLVARHVSGPLLGRHAAIMAEVWGPTALRMVGIPEGHEAVDRFNINPAVLHAAQDVAVRCWMGVTPTTRESLESLKRYYDPGIMLAEVLFNTWFFLRAGKRVAALRDTYRPLLERCLDALLSGGEATRPELRFVADSLGYFGWDRARLARDTSYRESLLSSLDFYKHLFSVTLPSVGSTGGAILFLLHELAGHEELQEILRDELSRSDLIAEPRAPRYTAMAIKEGLRLYPEASGISRVLTEPRCYGGYFVPEGTYTFVHLYSLHRNLKSHRDPERFDPMRFAAPEAATGGRWAGFSLGRMACTGRGFAELHIATALKELLCRYRLRRVDDRPLEHNDYRISVTLQPEPYEIRFESLW